MAGLSVLVIEAISSWMESLQILENCLSSVNLVSKVDECDSAQLESQEASTCKVEAFDI